MRRELCWIFVFCSIGFAGKSQVTLESGVLPVLNINYKINTNWRLNLKSENRFAIWQVKPTAFSPAYELSDLSVVVSRKVGVTSSAAGGYLLRYRSGELYHRFIVHFSIVRKYRGIRLGHRVSMDHTLASVERSVFRLRYRLTGEIALEGYELDQKEWYLKPGIEFLQSLQAGGYDLEGRLTTNLGYYFSDSNKLEFGVDYRLGDWLTTGGQSQNLWIKLEWYYQFGKRK